MDEVGSVEELAELDGRALIDVLKELEVSRRRPEGSIARVVAAAEQKGSFADDGHRSVRGWITASTNCSLGEALGRARTARMLRQLPECRARLEADEVGVDQVRALARVHANPRCGDQLPESEASLVEHARRLPFDDFVTVLRRWEVLADTDGANRSHELAHGRRTGSVVELGVGVVVEFRVGAMQGAAMREVFDRFCEAESTQTGPRPATGTAKRPAPDSSGVPMRSGALTRCSRSSRPRPLRHLAPWAASRW